MSVDTFKRDRKMRTENTTMRRNRLSGAGDPLTAARNQSDGRHIVAAVGSPSSIADATVARRLGVRRLRQGSTMPSGAKHRGVPSIKGVSAAPEVRAVIRVPVKQR
jgi:hypothetical protein